MCCVLVGWWHMVAQALVRSEPRTCCHCATMTVRCDAVRWPAHCVDGVRVLWILVWAVALTCIVW